MRHAIQIVFQVFLQIKVSIRMNHFILTLSFYDSKDNLDNCTKVIFVNTKIIPIQTIVTPFITINTQISFNISGQKSGNYTFGNTWLGANFTFPIFINPPPPTLSASPIIVYNCENFLIILHLLPPYFFYQVTLEYLSPLMTYIPIPVAISTQTAEIGLFYTQTAGTYTFCFTVYICNLEICYIPRIHCYTIIVLPCSPHYLNCRDIELRQVLVL